MTSTLKDAGAPTGPPQIDDADLASLAARIVPVVTGPDDRLYHIQPVDPRGVAFTWVPERTTPAEGLKPLAMVATYHIYGYHGLFKPSVAEVLAQLPTEVAEVAAAFSTELADGGSVTAIVGDYHRAITTVYTRG